MNVLRKYWKVKKSIFFLIEKEVSKVYKNGIENIVTISYKIKFIDSARFMESSLSSLVDNLAKGIYKTKYKDCVWFIEYESVN